LSKYHLYNCCSYHYHGGSYHYHCWSDHNEYSSHNDDELET
jgi:hypothetical protein